MEGTKTGSCLWNWSDLSCIENRRLSLHTSALVGSIWHTTSHHHHALRYNALKMLESQGRRYRFAVWCEKRKIQLFSIGDYGGNRMQDATKSVLNFLVIFDFFQCSVVVFLYTSTVTTPQWLATSSVNIAPYSELNGPSSASFHSVEVNIFYSYSFSNKCLNVFFRLQGKWTAQ